MNAELIKLASCEDFKRYCKALTKGNDLYNDLISDVIIKMNGLADLSLIKSIPQYAKTVAWNEVNRRNSDFNKKYKSVGLALLITDIDEENKDKEGVIIDIADEEVNIDEDYSFTVRVINKDLLKSIKEDKFPVQHELFKTYLELKTYRAVSKFYDIPRSTVHRLITEYKQRIKLTVEK